VLFVLGFVVLGLARGRKAPKRRDRRRARAPAQADRNRVAGLTERLCVVGGLAAPAVAVERSRAPLSWTTAHLRRRPTVHATTGLLDRLGDAELEAVLAHELSHIAHRDALIMTLIATPSTAFFGGLRAAIDDDWFRGSLAVLFYGLWLVPVALLMSAAARLVSRHRELTADRGAALLTGSPAAVAAALTAVAAVLAELRRKDLRAVASADLFHLLPSRPDEPGPLAQLWGTHPRLHRRLRELERMETRLQHARGRAG
jgi:heat shock protein HtpX